MSSEQARLLERLKAEAFDRLVSRYQELSGDDSFYSKNWVELSEAFEAELRKIRWISKDKG